MKVAMILAPCWTVDTAPLGISQVTAVLKEAGHEVKAFDFNVDLYHKCDKKYWHYSQYYRWEYVDEFQSLFFKIKDFLDEYIEAVIQYNPDMAGFSTFIVNRYPSLYIAKKLKEWKPSLKIVFGGCDTYLGKHSKEYEKEYIDAVVLGEGEKAILELIRFFESGGKLDSRYIKAKELVDINKLPLPDFSDFELENYKFKSIPLLTSRGCTGNCAFCGEKQVWPGFRFKDAGKLYMEMRKINEKYGLNAVTLNDSLINGNLTELEKFCDLMIDSDLSMTWGGYARVDKRMDFKFLLKMKKAGCKFLSFGIESGSQNVVDDMNKGFQIQDAEDLLRATFLAGIETHVNWVVGFPTEKPSDFMKSLNFLRRNKKWISVLNCGQAPCGIPPGCDIEKNPAKYGVDGMFMGNWKSKDNNIVQRKMRSKILRAFAKANGFIYN